MISIQKINDPAAFKAGVTDKANPADLKAAGGERIIRSTKLTVLDGDAPAFFTVQKFSSLEKAQAFVKTPAQEEINAARVKTTSSLSFIVEGAAN